MAKDDDTKKDQNEGEDEDLLAFEYDEDLLSEEGEVKEKEESIDLLHIAEEGKALELAEKDIEGLEKLLVDEEEVEKKAEAASEEEKDVVEDVLPETGEAKEEVAELAEGESFVSESPSGQEEETGDETVPMEKMEETFGEEAEPAIDLEEGIKLDEGVEGVVSGEDIEKLKEPSLEEVVEKEIPEKEEAVEEIPTEMPPVEGKVEALPISEEKIEALLTKVVSDVLEKVAREVMPEVAEKIIREEIDVLKKSIMPED